MINDIDKDFSTTIPLIPDTALDFDTDLKSAILPKGCVQEPATIK